MRVGVVVVTTAAFAGKRDARRTSCTWPTSPLDHGHHVREIFNAYQLNAKRREGDHGDDDGGGIENVTFGPGRAFCRVQFREVEDAEYARENLDGVRSTGRRLRWCSADSASCGKRRRIQERAREQYVSCEQQQHVWERRAGTFRGRREFVKTTMTTNGTHRQQHHGADEGRVGARLLRQDEIAERARGRDRGRRRGYSRSRSRSPPESRSRSRSRSQPVLARESDIAGDTEITSREDDATVARGLVRRLREEEGPEVTTTTTMMTIWMMVVKTSPKVFSRDAPYRRRNRSPSISVQGLRMKGEEEEDEVIESTRTRKC